MRNIDSFKSGENGLYGWMRAILVNDIRSAKRTKAARNTPRKGAQPVCVVGKSLLFLNGLEWLCRS